MSNRLFQLCRVCGFTHSNPRSSAICLRCERIQSAENAAEREHDERTYTARKYDGFEDAQTVEELKDWIRKYML
jgi:hypothetical protein|tara:strand:- start:125 stop:346 length:222 start_codon:yes stop_codon:yes gene_type:complete